MKADLERLLELGGSGAPEGRAAMVATLRAVADDLPAVAREALDAADGYWRRGLGDPAGLLNAKVACWDYLDGRHGSSTAVTDREDRLIRALLCVLEPEGDREDVSLRAEWFSRMLSTAGG